MFHRSNISEATKITLGLTVQSVDVDEYNYDLNSVAWTNLEWNDLRLKWNPDDYGGMQSLNFYSDQIWIPGKFHCIMKSKLYEMCFCSDVMSYVDPEAMTAMTSQRTFILVQSNGDAMWVKPGFLKFLCKYGDLRTWPIRNFRCQAKFGSWTSNGWQVNQCNGGKELPSVTILDIQTQISQINPQLKDEHVDISSYTTNLEWELISADSKRNEVFYECCPEPYTDITFILNMKRRPMMELTTINFPCTRKKEINHQKVVDSFKFLQSFFSHCSSSNLLTPSNPILVRHQSHHQLDRVHLHNSLPLLLCHQIQRARSDRRILVHKHPILICLHPIQHHHCKLGLNDEI